MDTNRPHIARGLLIYGFGRSLAALFLITGTWVIHRLLAAMANTDDIFALTVSYAYRMTLLRTGEVVAIIVSFAGLLLACFGWRDEPRRKGRPYVIGALLALAVSGLLFLLEGPIRNALLPGWSSLYSSHPLIPVVSVVSFVFDVASDVLATIAVSKAERAHSPRFGAVVPRIVVSVLVLSMLVQVGIRATGVGLGTGRVVPLEWFSVVLRSTGMIFVALLSAAAARSLPTSVSRGAPHE